MMREFGVNQPISGRKTYYGQVILNYNNGAKDVFKYQPHEIAYDLHFKFNLPINNIDASVSDQQYLKDNSDSIIEEFDSSFRTIFLLLHPKDQEINSHSVHIATGKSIYPMLMDKEIIG